MPSSEAVIDLRSDTVTRPTPAMRAAMARAEVGNSAFGEDPTVNELEARFAEVLGKEAALFLPSGTMGNQVALMVWTHRLEDPLRGPEVLAEEGSHIVQWESGGLARLSGAQTVTLASDRGAMDPAAVARRITGPEAYPIRPVTACVCLENTHNLSGGSVVPQANVQAVAREAHARDVAVHLDGARLFNAAVASQAPPAHLTAPVDSVMVSLSKGLACPVGSILAGPEAFIAEAQQARTLLGGAMRQAGVLAACGLVALDEMVDRLAEDHAHAKQLAQGMVKHEGIELAQASVETNIVYLDVGGLGMDAEAFCQALEDHGVWMDSATGGSIARAVTHVDVSQEDVEATLAAVDELVQAA
ncbi:MAG: GntG family PLP-dependent aldolase [Candidatus Thermoplasmatota archaeon]|nr:GntG family PLP-dependent aldolase [Candidatus Thermoplasmatota archaeon]